VGLSVTLWLEITIKRKDYNKKTIITILLALVALVGQGLKARKSIRYENIAPIFLSSFSLSPSTPDSRALPISF